MFRFSFVSRVVLAAMGLSPTISGAAGGHDFNFADLKSTIQDRSVTTIDALLPLLPEALRKNALLVYDSHALNTHLVTPATPRIVLFNKDASLILALTRHPGEAEVAAGNDTLEVIHFDRAAKRFEIGEIAFDGRRVPAGNLENSARCTRCHGTNPRPIFEDYNGWPGFFGSFGTKGVAVAGSEEHRFFKDFLAKQASLPRYEHLDLGGVSEDARGIANAVRGYGGLHDQLKVSPNLTFGTQVETLMHDRLGAKLAAMPEYMGVAPIYYHLGERSDRCGPIRQRIRETFAMLVERAQGMHLAHRLLGRISAQVMVDHVDKENELLRFNVPSVEVDPRGLVNIPYENLAIGYNPNAPVDREAYEQQIMLMEILFRHLRLEAADVSTTPGHPTSGIYHLSRLGRLLIDEQYFQNFIGGLASAAPDFLPHYDSLSCEAVREEVRAAISAIPIPDADRAGVLYR